MLRFYNIVNIIYICVVNWWFMYLNELFDKYCFKFKFCGVNSFLKFVNFGGGISCNWLK